MTPEDVLAMARAAVMRVTPKRLLSGYGDDLVQETAMQLLELERPSWRWARVFAKRAMRQVFGDRRYRPSWDRREPLLDDDVAMEARRESGALCLVRLQRLWPTLTEHQRAGLLTLMDNDRRALGETAAVLGVSNSSLVNARRRALQRLDNPARFSRIAKRPTNEVAA